MFSKEKPAADKILSTSATLISAGTIVHGDLESESDLRIDGAIHGNVTSKAKIIVGPTGFVEGNIQGLNADVTGRVVGHVSVKEAAQLRNGGDVQGNISAATLQIEAGAAFNGQSIMNTARNVVQMNEGELLHAKAN